MLKLIEMTLDGRLTMVWVALACLVMCGVVEWLSRRSHNRRVSGSQRQRKY